VLTICLESLFSTTNTTFTNITIINNNSCKQVHDLITRYMLEGKVDKYVQLSENRGKVEPILNEAKSCNEEFITISDADVFFREGWFQETIELFKVFDAGVVMPLPVPNLHSYYNIKSIVNLFLTNGLKKEKVVDIKDMKEFEKSIGSNILKKYYDQQYIIKKDNILACLGSGHFVATYDKSLFSFIDISKKVPFVFQNGQEEFFLDNLSLRTGTLRIGTTKSYVYHMGNTIPNFKINSNFNAISIKEFPKLSRRKLENRFSLLIYRIAYKIIKKII